MKPACSWVALVFAVALCGVVGAEPERTLDVRGAVAEVAPDLAEYVEALEPLRNAPGPERRAHFADGRYASPEAVRIVSSVEGFDALIAEIVRIAELPLVVPGEEEGLFVERGASHLAAMREMARLLDVASRLAWDADEPEQAAEYLHAMLKLADHAATDRAHVASFIAQLIAMKASGLLGDLNPERFDAEQRRLIASECERRASTDVLRCVEAMEHDRDWLRVFLMRSIEEHGGGYEAIRPAMRELYEAFGGEPMSPTAERMLEEDFYSRIAPESWEEDLEARLAAYEEPMRRAIDAWPLGVDAVRREVRGFDRDEFFTTMLPGFDRLRQYEAEHDEAFACHAERFGVAE